MWAMLKGDVSQMLFGSKETHDHLQGG